MEYNELKSLIVKKGYTNKEFCKMLNISDVGFKKGIERGSLKYQTLQKIGELLGIPIELLLNKNSIERTSVLIDKSGNVNSFINNSSITTPKIKNEDNAQLSDYKKQIEYLERLLEEKERMIKLLESLIHNK